MAALPRGSPRGSGAGGHQETLPPDLPDPSIPAPGLGGRGGSPTPSTDSGYTPLSCSLSVSDTSLDTPETPEQGGTEPLAEGGPGPEPQGGRGEPPTQLRARARVRNDSGLGVQDHEQREGGKRQPETEVHIPPLNTDRKGKSGYGQEGGSDIENHGTLPRTGGTGSPEHSSGKKEGRKTLLSGVTISSRVWRMLCVLLFLLVLILAALTGYYSSQDAPVPPRFSTCPMDWLYSRNRCYYFSMIYKEEGEWDESHRVCCSHNGSLALFDTQEELNFLMDISGEHHAWVGLRKTEDRIHWANGTACSSSLCTITDSGECVFIGYQSLWLSSCGLPRPYICTKEPYV